MSPIEKVTCQDWTSLVGVLFKWIDDKIETIVYSGGLFKLFKQLLIALLAGTTTSLYGKTKTIPLSQYDRLDHWNKMGWTAGSVSFETERSTRKLIQQWLMKNHTRKYFEWYIAKKKSGQPHMHPCRHDITMTSDCQLSRTRNPYLAVAI